MGRPARLPGLSTQRTRAGSPGCPALGTWAGTGVPSPGSSPPGPRWHPSRRAHGVCDRGEEAGSGREAGAPRFRASVRGDPPRSRGYELARSRPSAAPSPWQAAAGREPRIALRGTRNRDCIKCGRGDGTDTQPSDQPLRGGHGQAPPPSPRSLLPLAPCFSAPNSFPSRKWSAFPTGSPVLFGDWSRVPVTRAQEVLPVPAEAGKRKSHLLPPALRLRLSELGGRVP